MEEFRLGGVQSGLAVLCHMVSLIAVFSLRQRGTPKEVVERRQKKRPRTGAKVFDCFDVALNGYLRLPN